MLDWILVTSLTLSITIWILETCLTLFLTISLSRGVYEGGGAMLC
jgi:hypothetical protein